MGMVRHDADRSMRVGPVMNMTAAIRRARMRHRGGCAMIGMPMRILAVMRLPLSGPGHGMPGMRLRILLVGGAWRRGRGGEEDSWDHACESSYVRGAASGPRRAVQFAP